MFDLGKTSRARMADVHPDLARVVTRAITLTAVDFAVVEGRRDPDRQRALVAAGASRTLDSRHLTGHAVDLAPYVGGAVRWDWPLVYQVADAMLQAGRLERVPLRWGGAWDRIFDSTQVLASAEALSAAYVARRRQPFLDGPHFELPREKYPVEV